MERMLQPIQPLVGVTGRMLLGLYFLIPGTLDRRINPV